MKTALILVALACGLQVAFGRSMFQQLLKRKSDDGGLRQHIKDEIMEEMKEVEQYCPEVPSANCEAIATEGAKVIEQIYGNLEQTEAELEASEESMEAALAAIGVTDELEQGCTYYMCMMGAIYEKHQQGEKLPFCEPTCDFKKRSFYAQVSKREFDSDSGEDEGEEILYALCGFEMALDNCPGIDNVEAADYPATVESCATTIADLVATHIEGCFAADNQVQKKSALVTKLKTLLSKRGSEVKRRNLMNKLKSLF